MIASTTEMIEYTTACRMAEVYRTQTERILAAIEEIEEAQDCLKEVFYKNYRMEIELYWMGRQKKLSEKQSLLDGLKIEAWRVLIEKLGVRKVMPSKKQRELDEILDSSNTSNASKLPDISEDTIMSVLQGYVSSASSFLEEAIHEEWEHWKTTYHPTWKTLKTKQKSWFKVDRKVIKSCMVDLRWSGKGFQVRYDSRKHLMGLDNIMHLLDGKGAIKGYSGPLVDAIESSPDGTGETEYFRFKCYKNSNLHLEFKRQDLLDRFNSIAADANKLGHK